MNGSVGVALEPLADLDAVDLRHHDVEQDQVGQLLLGGGQRLLAVGGLLELVALRPSRAIRMSRLVSLSSTIRIRGGLCMVMPDCGRYRHVLADLRQQRARAVGLGDIGVAAGGARLALVAGQRIGGDDDDRNALELRHRP